MGSIVNALAMRELLQQIFQYCDPNHNFQNVLVSKKWSDEALGALWHRIKSVKPLLSLLAPLVLRMDGKYDFEHRPRSRDWAVFQKYSWRVHHLSIGFVGAPKFSESVFLYTATSRPLCDLFPNLCSLRVPQPMVHVIPLFIHGGLADLAIHMLTKLDDLEMVTYLPDRCPNLTRLELRASGNALNVSIGLADVLSALPRLTELHITPRLLTQPVISILARLPLLEHLNSTWEFPLEREGRTRSIIIIPQDARNGFSSIKTLALCQSFEAVASFLESSKASDLRHLSIDPDRWQSPDHHLRILAAASTFCPNLETLNVVEWDHDHDEGEIVFPQRELATWELFQPLLRLSNLTSLAFVGLRIDVDALLNIGKALPSLQRLALRSTSSIDGPPSFPISILPTLGSLCPQLKLLCLYVDTTPPALTPIRAITGDIPPLACLEELDVGPSSLDSPASEVAAYLSSILTEDCRLVRLFDEYLSNGGLKYASWQPVIEFLPIIIRVRKAEKEAAITTTSV